jgi:glycerol-3-phosphate acyltransferase PlsY
VLKGTAAVWVARALLPDANLTHVLAPLAAILGHNHSIFLPEFDQSGRFVRLGGGAGGATTLGGAMGLWWPAALFGVPFVALTFFTVGIASVTTMSAALFGIIVFAVSASHGLLPWVEVLYPVVAAMLVVWALRPNFRRLLAGEERVVKYSLYGKLRERRAAAKRKGKN